MRDRGDVKTYQQEIGDLVTLALSPPEVPSMAAGSATHDRLLDAWQANVRGSARALWHRVLGVDPRAVRICEMILAEFSEV